MGLKVPKISTVDPRIASELGRTICAVAHFAVLAVCLHGALAHADQLVWQSGFEKGFPSEEWHIHDNVAYSPASSMPADRVSAWTIVSRRSGEPVFAGDHAYKGWIVGPASDSHRAYPVVLVDIPTPLVNTFMVYLDTNYDQMSRTDWIHFGTWGNRDATTNTGDWALHTMSVRDRKLGFAHVSPFQGEYIGPAMQPDFPLRRWVRFTVYMTYQGTRGFVQVWQDGVPMLRAQVSKLEVNPGTRLRTAHWGMYASGTVGQGTQYNDDIRICTLEKPLADLLHEPRCAPNSASPAVALPAESSTAP